MMASAILADDNGRNRHRFSGWAHAALALSRAGQDEDRDTGWESAVYFSKFAGQAYVEARSRGFNANVWQHGNFAGDKSVPWYQFQRVARPA